MNDFRLQNEISCKLGSNLWKLMDNTIFIPGFDLKAQQKLGGLRDNNVNVRFMENLRSFLNFHL